MRMRASLDDLIAAAHAVRIPPGRRALHRRALVDFIDYNRPASAPPERYELGFCRALLLEREEHLHATVNH